MGFPPQTCPAGTTLPGGTTLLGRMVAPDSMIAPSSITELAPTKTRSLMEQLYKVQPDEITEKFIILTTAGSPEGRHAAVCMTQLSPIEIPL